MAATNWQVDEAKARAIGRRYANLTLTYGDGEGGGTTAPQAAVFVAPYASVEFKIPAAFNGKTLSVKSCDNAAKTGAAVPKRYDDTTTAYVALASIGPVTTGERYIIEAAVFGIHWISIEADGAVADESALVLNVKG
jgi:hypothetical protein